MLQKKCDAAPISGSSSPPRGSCFSCSMSRASTAATQPRSAREYFSLSELGLPIGAANRRPPRVVNLSSQQTGIHSHTRDRVHTQGIERINFRLLADTARNN